jgi:F0F1-type ATP synthase assembly protein I
MMRVAGIVGEFSAAIIGGFVLGWLIDRWAGTSPRWTAILAGVGIVGGGYNFIRRAMALNKADSAGGPRGER